MALTESYVGKIFNKLLSFSDNLSRNIHNANANSEYLENFASNNAKKFANDYLGNNEVSINEIEKLAKSYIESGQITQQDFDNYINNLFTGDLDYKRSLEMLENQMAFNSAEAEKNRQWQTDMSNTAFQRQANDLKSAGYNPALMLGGSGASVMSVNTPTSSGSYSGINSNLVSLANSALSSNTNLTKGILSFISTLIKMKK